jgi:hypothetical protein
MNIRRNWPLFLALLLTVAAITLRATGFHATAQFRDGTYSWSHNHSGTCSGHRGVKVWYR